MLAPQGQAKRGKKDFRALADVTCKMTPYGSGRYKGRGERPTRETKKRKGASEEEMKAKFSGLCRDKSRNVDHWKRNEGK